MRQGKELVSPKGKRGSAVSGGQEIKIKRVDLGK